MNSQRLRIRRPYEQYHARFREIDHRGYLPFADAQSNTCKTRGKQVINSRFPPSKRASPLFVFLLFIRARLTIGAFHKK